MIFISLIELKISIYGLILLSGKKAGDEKNMNYK